MSPINSWPNSAWAGMPKTVMAGRDRRPGSAPRASRPGRPAPLLLDQRAVALVDRPEGLGGGNGRPELVVIPRPLRLGRLLHLVEEHVVDLPAVRADGALAEQRVVGRRLLHARD